MQRYLRDRDPWEVVMNDLWVVVFELGPGRAEESRSEKRCETESSSTFLSPLEDLLWIECAGYQG